jgi:inosine-uridine nucleoside N-ribohydrolase
MSARIILDTDPGVGIPGTDADDPIALFLAIAHPGIELLGVTTTFGNCPPALGARGARAVLDSAGLSDVPVVAGRPEPLEGGLPPLLVEAYAGARGRAGSIPLPEVAPSERTAADFIVETVRANPGEVTLVLVGPQTNLALALRQDPELAPLVKEIVFMGGALGLPPYGIEGNVTPSAECNIWFDPIAADEVLHAGIPMRMVGLDVTNEGTGLVLTPETIGDLPRGTSPALDLFAEICTVYLEAPMFVHGDGCVLYDPLAMAVVGGAEGTTFEPMRLAVDVTDGDERGRTYVPSTGSGVSVDVCTAVEGRRVVDDIVATILALR